MSDAYVVLVIEPDESQRQLIDVLLSDQRLRIEEHATARSALERLRTATPDLVIVAADLPDLDGLALTSRLKRVARLADVPVIVTADPDAGSGLSRSLRLRAEESSVDLLLPRPLGDKNLKERALRLILSTGHGPAGSARALRNTVLIAAEHGRAAGAGGPPARPQVHLDAAALERENYALRRENHELRATIDRLKRQLPGGRNKLD